MPREIRVMASQKRRTAAAGAGRGWEFCGGGFWIRNVTWAEVTADKYADNGPDRLSGNGGNGGGRKCNRQ